MRLSIYNALCLLKQYIPFDEEELRDNRLPFTTSGICQNVRCLVRLTTGYTASLKAEADLHRTFAVLGLDPVYPTYPDLPTAFLKKHQYITECHNKTIWSNPERLALLDTLIEHYKPNLSEKGHEMPCLR